MSRRIYQVGNAEITRISDVVLTRLKPQTLIPQWSAEQSFSLSIHAWLEERGPEKMYLIALIDDATSTLFARFVPADSTEQHMRVLWAYLERNGRPQSVYTDRASLF